MESELCVMELLAGNKEATASVCITKKLKTVLDKCSKLTGKKSTEFVREALMLHCIKTMGEVTK